jgi:hypothetical protein
MADAASNEAFPLAEREKYMMRRDAPLKALPDLSRLLEFPHLAVLPGRSIRHVRAIYYRRSWKPR